LASSPARRGIVVVAFQPLLGVLNHDRID